MAEEIVRIIKVDTKNSDKSINDLRKEIKGLRSELDKAVVGSEEFESTLKQLTQAQKTYNSVQQQVRDMSKTNQQDMARFASFARNLGKAYSSLNAAIGLFANGNEDVQKAMLRVQRTIQLVQGLDGIAGLVRDLPKVANAFKGWLSFLNPIEKQVDRIAKGINGIDPKKVKLINEANKNAAKVPQTTTTAAAAGGGQQQYLPAQTEELKKQATTYYPALLEQERNLRKARAETAEKMQQTSKTLESIKKLNKDILQAALTASGKTMPEILSAFQAIQKGEKDASEFLKELSSGDLNKFEASLKKMGYDTKELLANTQSISSLYADQYKELGKLNTEYDQLNAQYEEVSKQIKIQEAGMTKFQKTLAKTGVVGRAAFNMLKTAIASIGIGLLIAGITAAGAALIKYIKSLQSAAKEQKKFNKEVSELTNKTAAKSIVVLKELSYAYQKLGDDAKAKEKFLEQYADKIKETGIAVTDVKKAEDVFINNTDNYVNAIMARAKAQAVEQKAIEIYQEYLDKRYDLEQKVAQAGKNLISNIDYTNVDESFLDIQEVYEELGAQIDAVRDKAVNESSDTYKELLDQMFDLDKDIEERLRKMFENVADLEKEYLGFFATVKSSSGGGAEIAEEFDKVSEKIQQLIEYYKQAEEILNDPNYELEEKYAQELDWTRKYYDAQIELAKGNATEISKLEAERDKKLTDIRNKFENETLHNNYLKDAQEIEDRYSVQIDLAKEYNQDTIQLEEARERELAALRRKYNDDILKSEEDRINNEVSYLQKQIEIIRDVYESEISKLREPREEDYQTNYYFLGAYAATSQTFKQIKEQRDAEIQYNNDSLEALRERIGKENYELAKQLETVELTEKEKYNIRKRMSDNTKELSNAEKDTVVKNEEAKAKAQIKFQTAVQASVEVAGSLTSAIANMYKLQAQDEKKSAEEREKAAKKYKAWAKAQAIIDTFGAANAAFRAMADIPPSPVWGIAAAAAAIAAGMANVRAIEQESVVSSTSSSISGSSVSAPPAMQTPPIEYTRELVGDRELDKLNDPIKCYVLEAEIRSVADKVRVTESNASF